MKLAAPLLLFAVAACGDDGGSSTPDAGAPDAFTLAAPADRAALLQPGPYTVGYRQQAVTYRPIAVAVDRTLNVEVWYPAAPGTGTDTTYQVGGVLAVPRPGPRTHADVMAEGSFPVVVYSHGSGGLGLVAYSYGEYLASWGFVFVAPDHTGNTALDSTNPLAFDYLVRPQDLSATLDAVTSTGPLAGRTSGDVAAIGHSFGGYTVLSLLGAHVDPDRIATWGAGSSSCEQLPEPDGCAFLADPAVSGKLAAGFADPRIETAVAQTPVSMVFQEGELAAISAPVMLVTARRDATLPWAIHGEPTWERLDGAADVWVDLENGGHYSVIEVCEVVDPGLLAAFGLDVINDGCGPSFTPIPEIVPPVMAYAHAFIREHALGETRWAAVIAGEPFHADIAVTTHED
jgi:predicted dienelactone hydrolase